MGSATHAGQVDLDGAMKERNREHGVHHGEKAKARAGLTHPGIPESMISSAVKHSETDSDVRCRLLVEVVDPAYHLRRCHSTSGSCARRFYIRRDQNINPTGRNVRRTA